MWFLLSTLIILGVLAACGSDNGNNDDESNGDTIDILEVEFNPPETASVGDTVTLEAIVTLGDDTVTDAEVKFEYWISGDQDNSTFIDGVNNDDGTYTADVTFDQDAEFEMYAHTDAADQHTMPKRTIKVGEGGTAEAAYAENAGHDDHNSHSDHNDDQHDSHGAEGFSMHFMELDKINVGAATDLIVHLHLGDEPLEDVSVKYEIWQDGDEKHEWLDAEATKAGEYKAVHSFSSTGTYSIQIHVEDEKDLHEHDTYTVDVTE